MKDTSIVTRLAWRNVWRNKRRTILTFLTIVVGCAMIIFMNSIAKGGHDQMIEDAISINSGHIQIHERGFWDNQTIDYAFQPTSFLLKNLKDDHRISGYGFRVHAGGLLSFKGNTAGTQIQGVDPELEKGVTNLHTKILPGGRYLKKDDRNMVILGEKLAKNLGASVGSIISMISQGFDGSIAAERLTIVGLFRSGNPAYDLGLLIMPISLAKETFTMMDYIHSIAIKLVKTGYTEDVKTALSSAVANEEIELMGWDELMPELIQFIIIDDAGNYIFIFILFMLVAFGVLNTIQMSVFERIRELGIMLSLGTRPGQIIKMILLESTFISIIGIILGISLGCVVSYYFKVNPLDYSGFSEEMEVWGVSTIIFPADTSSLNIFITSAITFILSLLFSFFPARRASKLKPVEAIRHL